MNPMKQLLPALLTGCGGICALSGFHLNSFDT